VLWRTILIHRLISGLMGKVAGSINDIKPAKEMYVLSTFVYIISDVDDI